MKRFFFALVIFLTALSQITFAQQDFKAEFKKFFDKNNLAAREGFKELGKI